MNNDRFFGIEIECISNIPSNEMGELINNAFVEHGIRHRVTTTHYGHSRGDNTTRWEIKPDGSIQPNSTYRYGCEVVSPKLKGVDGLNALRIVCEAINGHVNVNRSCGLHVHHDLTDGDPRHLINAWIDYERFFMAVTPASRRDNRYCKTWSRIGGRRMSKMFIGRRSGSSAIRQNVQTWWNQNIDTRYTTLNMEGYLFRGAAEFRLHSATYEYDKMANWIIATQRFTDIAVSGRLNGAAVPSDFSSFCNKMRNGDGGSAQPVASANNSIHPEAKKQRLPRENSKLGVIARLLLNGGFSKSEIADQLRDQFGNETGSSSYEFQIGCKMADFASLKYGFGWEIREDGGRFYIAGAVDLTSVVPSNTDVDNDINSSFDWMAQRYETFASIN